MSRYVLANEKLTENISHDMIFKKVFVQFVVSVFCSNSLCKGEEVCSSWRGQTMVHQLLPREGGYPHCVGPWNGGRCRPVDNESRSSLQKASSLCL